MVVSEGLSLFMGFKVGGANFQNLKNVILGIHADLLHYF